jgi:hypothetical protein
LYTADDRYYAPEGNSVLLACDGRYHWNNRFLRVWRGHLYGRTYNGPIVRNYSAGSGDGSCGFADPGEETTYESGSSRRRLSQIPAWVPAVIRAAVGPWRKTSGTRGMKAFASDVAEWMTIPVPTSSSAR